MLTTRRRGWRRRLTATALGTGLALGAAELLLRIVGFSCPVWQEHDPVLGTRLRPGLSAWYRNEGNALVETNALGMRDIERSLAKPPGTFRIAVLGDSYMEARQVPRAAAFCARLEVDLTSRGACVEVLNFSCSGYATTHEYLLLERVWAFQPDLVLLAFLTGNDVRDNSRELTGTVGRPYFVVREGRLDVDTSFLESNEYAARSGVTARFLRASIDRLRLLQLLNGARLTLLRTRQLAAAREAGGGELVPGREMGLDEQVYVPPRTPEWLDAWDVTERLLLATRDAVTARGARLGVVVLSNGTQVHPDRSLREGVARRLGVDDTLYPDRRIEALLAREGVPVLLLAPELRRWAEAHQEALHGFEASGNLGTGHWNARGHELAARLAAEWVELTWLSR